MLNTPFYKYQDELNNQFQPYANIYNSYMTVAYMHALQNQAMFMSKLAPVRVLITNDLENRKYNEVVNTSEEKIIISQKFSENKSTFEDKLLISSGINSKAKDEERYSSFRKKGNN